MNASKGRVLGFVLWAGWLSVTAGVCGSVRAAEPVVPPFEVWVAEAGKAAQLLAEVRLVTVDDLVVDVHGPEGLPGGLPASLAEAAADKYRLYAPGRVHVGSVTIRCAPGFNHGALEEWWEDVGEGENVRKTVTIITRRPDGSEVRRWLLLDCFPTAWTAAAVPPTELRPLLPNLDPLDTLVCRIGSVELAVPSGTGTPPAEPGRVAMTTTDTLHGELSDYDWDEWLGGDAGKLKGVGGSKYGVALEGKRSVEVLTLRGLAGADRQALCHWVNDAAVGWPWRLTFTLRELKGDGSDKKLFAYGECFPTRYVFPIFSMAEPEALVEQLSLKPIRPGPK